MSGLAVACVGEVGGIKGHRKQCAGFASVTVRLVSGQPIRGVILNPPTTNQPANQPASNQPQSTTQPPARCPHHLGMQ